MAEVRYMNLLGQDDIPPEAAQLYNGEGTYRKYIVNLSIMIRK